MMALGAELRRDTWKAIGLASNDLSTALNGQIDLLGGDNIASGANSSTSTSISRDVTSLFAELDVPIRKDLTLNASVRGDKYSDLGETTWNPKLSLRYTPLSSLVLRASANTGYRAPSLPEIYTKEGIDWVEENSMKSVISRHFPPVAFAMEGLEDENAFKPWKPKPIPR